MASLPMDEKVNVWTHGIGLLLSILGIPFLLYNNSGINLIALLTFLLGMIAMFFSSTVYHITNKDVLKNRWRVVDHISIFFIDR
jgi:hemolysin III